MSNNNSSNGISTLSLLGIAFIVLKLTNVIDWSWWYVTMPFWIGIAILLIVILVIWSAHYRKVKRFKKYKENLKSQPKRKSRFQQKMEDAINKGKQLNK